MITRLVLRNFQRWKKLDIVFDQVTTFVGQTDSGKSAIIRALRWVVTNSPRGNSFVRHGSKKACSVTLYVDGHVIKRSRLGSVNSYWMDGHTYSAFNTGVPEPIQNVLKMTVDNFQQQHDPIFWLSLSPPEVSKRLNEIADLQIMDDSIRKALSIKKECEHRVKFCKEQRLAARKAAKPLRIVPEMVEAWGKLEESHDILVQNRTDCTRLRNALVIGKAAAERVERLETPTKRLKSLVALEKQQTQLRQKIKSLRLLVGKASANIPSNLNKLNISVGLSILETKRDQVDRLCDLLSAHNQHAEKIPQWQSRLTNLKASISKVSAKCPTCGRPMPIEK